MSKFRNFCFTLNNYDDEAYHRICELPCRYLVIGKEVGESGTPHLQGYICYKNQRSEKGVRKDLPGAHVEVARGTPLQASDYCKKSDKDFFEKGDLPKDPANQGEVERERWQAAYDAVERKDYDAVPVDILCTRLKSIEYAVERKRAAKRKLTKLDGDLENEWIYGPTATGKSFKARTEHPDAYVKISASKWWDDYDYEDDVIIEEVGLKAADHADDFKQILDRFPFRAEVKGGSMLIRPKRVIITSNYHPSQIWTSSETLEPMLRRLNIIHMVLPFRPPPPPTTPGLAPFERSEGREDRRGGVVATCEPPEELAVVEN